jgi:hypothetical protein
MMRKARLCGLILGFGVMPMAHATLPHLRCSDPGVPTGSTLTWVAPRVAVDGLPMAILQLNSRLSPSTVLAWYQKHWRGMGPHPDDITYASGRWTVVARRRDGCFETVQIQASGAGTLGEVGISRPALSASAPMNTGIPLPAGSQTLLTMNNTDHGQRAQNLLAVVAGNPGAVRAYYAHLLPTEGWSYQWTHRVAGGDALMYQHGARTVEISITHNNGIRSNVLITVVHH